MRLALILSLAGSLAPAALAAPKGAPKPARPETAARRTKPGAPKTKAPARAGGRGAPARTGAAPKAPPAAEKAAPQETLSGPVSLSGVVEAFNTRTMTLDVRGADGRLYLVEVRNARFTAGDGSRAADYSDVRPAGTVQVAGKGVGRVVQATSIRLDATPGPGSGAARSTPAGEGADPADPGYQGVIRSIDTRENAFRLRAGKEELLILLDGRTEFGGFDTRRPDISHLRVGDTVRVEGSEEDGTVRARRVALEPPGPRGAGSRSGRAPRTRPDEIPYGIAGTIVSLDPDHDRVVLRTADGERTVDLRDAHFTRSGSRVKRSELKPGMRLLIWSRQREGEWIATDVVVQ